MTDKASPGKISRLLRQHAEGDSEVIDELMPLVYEQLRHLAHRQVSGNNRGGSLATTALVHEAYLRLQKDEAVDWQSRGHFYAICSRTMRRIVVDFARRRGAEKRGRGKLDLTLEPHHAVLLSEVDTWIAIDHALETLSAFNERLTRTVECRFFGGLSEEETAEALGVSRRTVQRDWLRARAWLRRELS